MSNDTNRPATAGRTSIAGDAADRLKDRASDAAEALRGAGAKATAAAHDASDKAADALGTAKDMAKDKASDTAGKVNEALEDRKAAGSERVKDIAGAIRRAADELEGELPPAATFIRRAADEIDAMADSVQRRDVRQLIGDVQSFARRQPAAFLGATVLGGFAILRLLKAPTAAHGDTDPASPAASHARSTSLVPVGRPAFPDDGSTLHGSGDPGGISPAAPGFAATSGPTGTGPRAGR